MFEKYDYVYAVYKHGSFTKAAKSLFISQPSLSVAIRNIEKEIGAPIFDRAGGGATLTEVGREYIRAVEKMMSARLDFKNRINDIYSLETGSITVGGTSYLASYVLPYVIKEFTARYPKIEIRLVDANSKSLKKMIENEEIDVVIDNFEEDDEVYKGYSLSNERILLCVPIDDEINLRLSDRVILPSDIYERNVDLASVPTVPVKEFEKKDFILLNNGNNLHEKEKIILEAFGIVPNVMFQVDQMNISFSLSVAGMGISFVTDTLFKYRRVGDRIALYNLPDGIGTRQLYVAHKKKRYCTRAMTEFVNTAHYVMETLEK